MTCIISAKFNGQVVIGCDSLVTTGQSKSYAFKLVKFGKIWVGASGIYTTQNTLKQMSESKKYVEKLKMKTLTNAREFAKDVFEQLREDFHYTDNESLLSNNTLLIATPTKIFTVDPYLAAFEIEDFVAIGCGGDIAMAALNPLYRRLTDPQNLSIIVEEALEVACQYNSGCGGKLIIHEV